jgi:hypothetical protein
MFINLLGCIFDCYLSAVLISDDCLSFAERILEIFKNLLGLKVLSLVIQDHLNQGVFRDFSYLISKFIVVLKHLVKSILILLSLILSSVQGLKIILIFLKKFLILSLIEVFITGILILFKFYV